MRARFSVVVVVVVAAAAACEQDCDRVEPAYADQASDEVWRVMIDARAAATPGDDAAVLTAPLEGLTQSDPVSFEWDAPLQTALVLPSSSPSPLSFTARRPQRSFLGALSQAVFPAAHAHEPPVTSDVHLLEIDVPGRTCPVAGLTTAQSFVFDDGSWEELTREPGERTLRILSAFVTENRITEGPFTSTPVTLRVRE